MNDPAIAANADNVIRTRDRIVVNLPPGDVFHGISRCPDEPCATMRGGEVKAAL
jgi:hypothetical protein